MANESVKTQNSEAIDRQVDVMARGDDPAQAVRDPHVEAQLDDLLADAPGPDEALNSLDRQLAALTAELLEGDFAEGEACAVVEAASAAPTSVSPEPAKAAPESVAVEASSSDAALIATRSAAPESDAAQPRPELMPPPTLPTQQGDMTLDEQVAALGADLLDGDFESVSGDVMGGTGKDAPVSAVAPAAEAIPAPTEAEARTGDTTDETAPPAAVLEPGAESPGAAPASALVQDSEPEAAPEAPCVGDAASSSSPLPLPPKETGSKAHVREVVAAPEAAPARPGRSIGARVRGAVWTLLRRAEPAAKQVAALASKPLEGRPPVIRQSIGWLAIWTAFLAMCALMASLMFRAPVAPETEAEPSTIDVPHEGEGEPAEPRAGENLRGRPIPPPGPHH